MKLVIPIIIQPYRAFVRSNECKANAWAYRDLSMIEMNEWNHPAKAVDYMEKAITLNNIYRGLMINCAQVMLKARAYEKWLKVFRRLDDKLQRLSGRIFSFVTLRRVRAPYPIFGRSCTQRF